VLFEDVLAIDGETLPLLAGLRATTEMQGITQIVQGRVFKSDHDCRRIFLHVTTSGFARSLDFPVSYGEGRGAGDAAR
jgi:hypothetical protein